MTGYICKKKKKKTRRPLVSGALKEALFAFYLHWTIFCLFACFFFLAIDDNSTQEERFYQITQSIAITLLGILCYYAVTCISQCFFSSRDNNIFLLRLEITTIASSSNSLMKRHEVGLAP